LVGWYDKISIQQQPTKQQQKGARKIGGSETFKLLEGSGLGLK